jgi:uncharacterized integral membrane protein
VRSVSEPPNDAPLVPAKSRSITPKQATTGVALVVAIVFALINFQGVTMHWVVGTTRTPLIILVAGCMLIGLGVGFLLGRRHRPTHEASPDR